MRKACHLWLGGVRVQYEVTRVTEGSGVLRRTGWSEFRSIHKTCSEGGGPGRSKQLQVQQGGHGSPVFVSMLFVKVVYPPRELGAKHMVAQQTVVPADVRQHFDFVSVRHHLDNHIPGDDG